MAAIQTRVTKLEARFGIASFEDQLRRVPTEVLEAALEATLLELEAMANAGQPDEAALAAIRRIERCYR
jgi:hypothetical protein